MKSPLLKSLIFLLFISGKILGQSVTDSLIKELKKNIPDSTKAKIYNDISSELRYSGSFDSSLTYGKRGLEISLKNNYHLTSAKLYNTIGTSYAFLGDNQNSELHFIKAIEYSQKTNNKKILAKSYSNLGRLYFNVTKYNEAYKYYLLSLKINQEMNNKESLANNYNNIGGLFYQQEKYPEALKYYFRSDSIYNTLPQNNEQAHVKNNIANIYTELKKFDLALKYFSESFRIHQADENLLGLASIYENAGVVLLEAFKYKLLTNGALFNNNKILPSQFLDSALAFHTYAYNIYKEADYMYNFSANLTGQGFIYYYKNNLPKAIEFCKQGLLYADSTESLDRQLSACGCLNLAYEKSNDIKNAYKYYKESIKIRDSIYNKKNTEKFLHQELSFEFEKKENQLKNEQEKKNIVHQNEKKRQTIIIYSITVILILIGIFSFYVFKNYLAKKKANIELENKNELINAQKHVIEEKHKEITDSINYAERIQRSFLATKNLLDENLRDYFVFFQPKDVVSGDFYWASKLNNGQFALATADSTGHGVPGAIMSLLNITSLEKAIERHDNPADILNQTRITIIERLKKDGSKEGGKDGMDCSLISFDFKNNKFTYAAANNPVWLVRGKEILEFAPDKMPVGKHDKDSISFTQHTIDVRKEDMVYAITDGMPDQFGGPKGKKFMYKQLKELFISISHLPVNEQKENIANTLTVWKGDLEQVDDICIIGVRV